MNNPEKINTVYQLKCLAIARCSSLQSGRTIVPSGKTTSPWNSDEVQARFPGCIKIGQSIPYKEAVPGYKPVVGQKIADMIRFFDYNTPTTSLFPENN